MASNWPLPTEAPADADLGRCVHCGLCLTSCPTYIVTGLEVESPRGRIHMAKLVNEGRSELTETIQQHWDLCLQCRACEAVCPSGVPYGRIQEHARAQLQASPPSGGGGRRVRRFALRNVIARPRVLGAVIAPARWYSGSVVRRLVGFTRVLRVIPRLNAMERSLPRRIGAPFRTSDLPSTVRGNSVSLLTGCVMGELFGDAHRATVRVLERSGLTVTAPPEQGCCGALHAHDGDLEFARRLARRNIDAFEGSDTIVVNSAGCGAAMKEYGDLLAHDNMYAGKAAAFSARVRDFSEVVAGLEVRPPARSNVRVTYQDACHLVHAQRIREQPRALLEEVAGCELVETSGADVCCGAAGIYSLVQPEMSADLRRMKAEQFAEAQPDVIVTGNPGCQLQYIAAVTEAGIKARVLHLAEFLDEAQRNAGG